MRDEINVADRLPIHLGFISFAVLDSLDFAVTLNVKMVAKPNMGLRFQPS